MATGMWLFLCAPSQPSPGRDALCLCLSVHSFLENLYHLMVLYSSNELSRHLHDEHLELKPCCDWHVLFLPALSV